MVPAMATIERYRASTVPVLADRARRVLEESGLIALPTESFYGLAWLRSTSRHSPDCGRSKVGRRENRFSC